MVEIGANNSGMLRLVSFCVCLNYASCLRSAVGLRTNFLRTKTSAWNVAQVAFAPAARKLLNCVLAVDWIQLRKELMAELILAR